MVDRLRIGVNLGSDMQTRRTRPGRESIWGNRPVGTESFEDFAKTVESLKTLGVDSVRLSIGWSQIIKPQLIKPEILEVDMEAVRGYKDMLRQLKEAGIKNIILTTHHFDEPQWFDNLGGWAKEENLKYYERYAEVCAQEFGQDANIWIPINEPNIYTSMGYLAGLWPPHEKNPLKARAVYRNLAKAHNLAAEIIKKRNPNAKIACAVQMPDVRAGRYFPKAIANLIGKGYEAVNNWLFIDRVIDSIDYIGVQSYSPFYIGKPKSEQTTDMGWPLDLTGEYLENVLVKTAKRYPNKPIIITENGIADKDDLDKIRESTRVKFIKASLQGVERAIKQGANIVGYFHWTIEDNYEMDTENTPDKGRFGLFRKDYETLKREITTGGRYYSRLIRWAKSCEKAQENSDVKSPKPVQLIISEEPTTSQ